MSNVFQSNYDARLKSWYDLRAKVESFDIREKCVEIDAWWQHAPMVNHYLHPKDTLNWPGPWELLVDNTYCTITRGLGICYTLVLTGVEAIDFCQGKDDNDEDVMIVLVDNAKYILNYWPDTVLNNCLEDFTVTHRIDISGVIKKIR